MSNKDQNTIELTIREIRELKVKAEVEIQRVIKSFIVRTGMAVEGVELGLADKTSGSYQVTENSPVKLVVNFSRSMYD